MTADEARDLLDYDPDTGIFIWKVRRSQRVLAGMCAGADTNGYRQIGIKGKRYRAARLAWLIMMGVWPKHQVDHKNRIKNDDRWLNLREFTIRQNQMNVGLRRDNTSGVKNVYFHKRSGKWRVSFQGKNRDFPTFETATAAAAVLPNHRGAR